MHFKAVHDKDPKPYQGLYSLFVSVLIRGYIQLLSLGPDNAMRCCIFAFTPEVPHLILSMDIRYESILQQKITYIF